MRRSVHVVVVLVKVGALEEEHLVISDDKKMATFVIVIKQSKLSDVEAKVQRSKYITIKVHRDQSTSRSKYITIQNCLPVSLGVSSGSLTRCCWVSIERVVVVERSAPTASRHAGPTTRCRHLQEHKDRLINIPIQSVDNDTTRASFSHTSQNL